MLILVQNLSVPFDRRVWLECQSLIAAGFRVAVVCPKAPGDPTYYRLNGVDLYKYPLLCSGHLGRHFRPRIHLFIPRHPVPQPQSEPERSVRRRSNVAIHPTSSGRSDFCFEFFTAHLSYSIITIFVPSSTNHDFRTEIA